METDSRWWDGHQAVFTASTGDHRASVTNWARAGLERGETLLYAADSAYPTVHELTSSLTEDGLGGIAQDQLRVIEAPDFYSTTGYSALIADAMDTDHPRVRSYGGPHIARSVLTEDEFLRFDRDLDRMWAVHGATAVCRYDTTATALLSHQLSETVARHASGWSEQLLHARWVAPTRMSLAGEIDVANDGLLVAVLQHGLAAAPTGFDIDCTNLRFVSAAGWLTLASAAQSARTSGAHLNLVDMPAHIARLMQLLGLDGALGKQR